jgi:hypothetical protein
MLYNIHFTAVAMIRATLANFLLVEGGQDIIMEWVG